MEKPVITTQDFKNGETVPECPYCYEGLVNPDSGYGMCDQCAKNSGQYCSVEGCYADAEIMTDQGLMCRPHAIEYLFDLYSEAYQLVQKLEEEFDELVDLNAELDDKSEMESEDPQRYYQKDTEKRAITSSYSTKSNTLRELKSEIEILQNTLDIHVIDL